uniref:Kelch domain-containing protein 4 n=1 Tax=Cacopsylla melanoneura TaxID=428564 RepID=A0A8D8X188_9HEMI
MGKKDKKNKGKGAEKTAAKTEKKLCQKLRKRLATLGEEDIEKIVKDIEAEEKRKNKVIEKVVPEPSRRANFSFVPHPDKDQLILFGGEFYDGQKTKMFNDLFFYNIAKNEWRLISAPGAPPPRCSHQMVPLSADKGQLWLFGGEFSSASESQFHHYKDLWVFRMAEKKWEKVVCKDTPPSRSGHRMICVKKHLVVFGGFHDNLRECKYYNDVHIFNLETYSWKRIEPVGTGPSPRSGCQMVPLPDGGILISGGYSKQTVKKDVDKGVVHTDSFVLTPDKNDFENGKWKWSRVKTCGVKISPRSSFPLCLAPPHWAYAFGGVMDIDQDEDDDMESEFYNDLYVLNLESMTWRTVTVSEKASNKMDVEGEQEVEGVEMEEEKVLADDGVFKVTQGPARSVPVLKEGSSEGSVVFTPRPRMSCGMAVKHGVLYLYGGLFEKDEVQYTLADFYSLDLKKLNEWKIILEDSLLNHDWHKEESSDSDDSEEDISEDEEDSDEDMAD